VELLFSFLVIALLILLNGMFVAAEFSIIGVRPSRVEQLAKEGNRTAIGIRDIVQNRNQQERYIATSQLGITLASLGLGMYGEPVIAHLLEGPMHAWFGITDPVVLHTISFVVALAFMTYLHVVLGEMVPKTLALQSAERVVIALSVPMALMQRIFYPAVVTLNQIGLWVLQLLRVPPPASASRLHTPRELEMIVSESFEGGMLDAEEQQLIANIFDFADRRVNQVMTPRTRLEAVPITVDEASLLEQVTSSPHSRFPVYEKNIDNIVGVLHLKDLVRQQSHGEPFDLRKLIRRAPVVPESLYVETLLATLKKLRQHMAIVIDEYGGTAGVVTLEDVVEEVVGEVRDEFDEDETPPLTLVEPGHIVAQGSVPLDEIEEHVELGEHDYDVETVAGLVLAVLSRAPVEGDTVTINDITFHVEAVEGLAIQRLSVHFPTGESEEVRAATSGESDLA
jgi:CBS domain containing-hemolysin-like protein